MTDVKKFFLDAFHHLGSNRAYPVIDVRFYPYAGLRHTIRLRSGQVYVRLSDICKDSPPEVMRALAFVLVAQVTGKKDPAGSRSNLPRILFNAGSDALVGYCPPWSRPKDDFKCQGQRLRSRKDVCETQSPVFRFQLSKNRRLPGLNARLAASLVIMIACTTQSRSARLSIQLRCRNGLSSSLFITRCCT